MQAKIQNTLVSPRHLAEYVLARVALTAILSLGYERSLRVARRLADLYYRLDRKHRERAWRNLRKTLPERSEQERERIAHAAYRSFTRTFLETAWIPRLLRPGRVPANATIRIHPESKRIMEEGKGAVIVTGHFANWELSGQLIALLGYPVNSVARTLDNPLLDHYVYEIRTMFGQGIVTKAGGVRGMARVLRRGHIIALLVDQATGRRGIPVDFMGRPSSTTPAPATMAIRFGVPMIPGRGMRVGPGNEYLLELGKPLKLPRTGDREEDVRALTEEMNRQLGDWIRERPEEWLWVHRRWKTPRGWNEQRAV